MADDVEIDIPESLSNEDEIEIAVGEAEPAKPAEVVTLSPADFAALKASGDSASAIKAGIEGLASRMQAPQQAPQPVNAPTQTPEEFYAEHADDMFDKEKAPKIMAQYNKMLMEREYGPMFNAQAQALIATKRELLEAKDEHFKKYKDEVEQLVKAQPANVQLNPNIYDQAWEVVRNKHRSEIEEESVNAKVNAAVEAKLKELGIDPKKPKADIRPDAYENSASRSSGTAPTSGARKPTVRLPDAATKKKIEDEAKKRGVEVKYVLQKYGYMSKEE